jgi:amidase
MKIVAKEQCVVEYSATNSPVLTVAPGEMFQLQTPSTLTHPEVFPNQTTIPVTGPIYIEDAKPGSVLRVDIIKIELTAGVGAILTIPGRGAFAQHIAKPECKVLPYDKEYVYFNDTIKIPLRPMVGKIGIAPAGKSVNCHAPGPHGGNMDITDITDGSSVYLPVFIDGALLACGDVHATMGDGESILSAVETEASLTLCCQVLDDLNLTHPIVVTSGDIMTVGEGQTLEEAHQIALYDMAQLLSKKLGLEFVDSARLISIAADLKINQIVNSLVGVRVSLPLSLLPSGSIPGM